MVTISRSFLAQTQIIGAADAYVTLSGTTESYSSDVDLETSGYEGAHVIIEVNFDITPTDDVEWRLYGSLDGTNYDDTAITAGLISKGTDPNQISIIVRGLLHFRIGVKQTGSTNSHDVRAYYQAWNYTSA